jgi:hypothetical protein
VNCVTEAEWAQVAKDVDGLWGVIRDYRRTQGIPEPVAETDPDFARLMRLFDILDKQAELLQKQDQLLIAAKQSLAGSYHAIDRLQSPAKTTARKAA